MLLVKALISARGVFNLVVYVILFKLFFWLCAEVMRYQNKLKVKQFEFGTQKVNDVLVFYIKLKLFSRSAFDLPLLTIIKQNNKIVNN